jgi:intracellular multiplication protein IcmK
MKVTNSLLAFASPLLALSISVPTVMAQTRSMISPVPTVPTSSSNGSGVLTNEQSQSSSATSRNTDAGSNGVGGNMPLTSSEREQVRQAQQKQQDQQVFHQMLRIKNPLTPGMIHQTQQSLRASQKASRDTPAPKDESQTVHISTEPGAKPVTIHVSPGYGGAITFLDNTGQPWPVISAIPGNPKAFQVLKAAPKDPNSSIFAIVPQERYAHTNLIVTLKGMSTPLILRLSAVDPVNNDRTDAIIGASGPNATRPTAQRSLANTDTPFMDNLINGVPPEGAKRVAISGGPAEGWLINGHFYLRTTMQLLMPARIGQSSGAGGVTVYELPLVPLISLTDSDGATVQLTVADNALVDGALSRSPSSSYSPNS